VAVLARGANLYVCMYLIVYNSSIYCVLWLLQIKDPALSCLFNFFALWRFAMLCQFVVHKFV